MLYKRFRLGPWGYTATSALLLTAAFAAIPVLSKIDFRDYRAKAAERRMRERLVRLDRPTRYGQALDRIRCAADVTIVVDWDALLPLGIRPESNLTFPQHVSADESPAFVQLQWATEAAGGKGTAWCYIDEAGIVRVSPVVKTVSVDAKDVELVIGGACYDEGGNITFIIAGMQKDLTRHTDGDYGENVGQPCTVKFSQSHGFSVEMSPPRARLLRQKATDTARHPGGYNSVEQLWYYD